MYFYDQSGSYYYELQPPTYYLPPGLFLNEIKLGRQYHYFRTTINNVTRGPIIIQFLGFNNGLVTLRDITTDAIIQVYYTDLTGWEYLGPQEPPRRRGPRHF